MKEWDQFWQISSADASYLGATGTHELFVDYWSGFFGSLVHLTPESRCIDVASGTGIVIRCAYDHFQDRVPQFTALDISSAAIDQLTTQFPRVKGVVADVADIPLEPASFEVVTSQFGAEYGGVEGITEAAKLVAPDGHLALVLHCRPGAIHDECFTSLKVIDQMQSARLFPLARTMFNAGFKAAQGGDSRNYERAVRKFRPSLRVLERALKKYGPGVASGFIARLKHDLEQISGRLQNYDPDEVTAWLSRLNSELLAYRGRMKSMTGSAMSRAQLERVCEALSQAGFSITESTALNSSDDSKQLAWSVQARRSTNQG